MNQRVMRYVIEALGIPESDMRDWWCHWQEDVLTVRLWNRRRLRVTGYDLFAFDRRRWAL